MLGMAGMFGESGGSQDQAQQQQQQQPPKKKKRGIGLGDILGVVPH